MGRRGVCKCECRARDYSRNDNDNDNDSKCCCRRCSLSFGVGVGFKGERSLCNNKLRDNGDDNGASVCWPEGERGEGEAGWRDDADEAA